MVVKNTLYLTNKKDWRNWLLKNHKNQKEIWLVYYRKETGKSRISYDDAVLEALCYGWIDGIIKKIDKERFAQRFSPRKPKSVLSQINKERVRELIDKKKMTRWGLKAIAHVFNPKKDRTEKLEISRDILRALQENKNTWKYFKKMPLSYRRIRVAYIEGQKRHEMDIYEKALNHFVRKTAQNKRIGFVKERRDVTIYSAMGANS